VQRGREGADLLGGEAVEEKVSGDEVAGRGAGRGGGLPVPGVGAMDEEARGIGSGAADLGAEHGGAGVDGVDADGRAVGEEAAVKRPSPSPRTRARRLFAMPPRKAERQRWSQGRR